MKIKRFENVWIMGLILSGAILLFLYILKLIFPSFVIETAQNEQICKIGRYIDTHKWAWYLASSNIIVYAVLFVLLCVLQKEKIIHKRNADNLCGYSVWLRDKRNSSSILCGNQ